ETPTLAVDCEVNPVRREDHGLHAVAVWVMKEREAYIVGNSERFLGLLCVQSCKAHQYKLWDCDERTDNLPACKEHMQVPPLEIFIAASVRAMPETWHGRYCFVPSF